MLERRESRLVNELHILAQLRELIRESRLLHRRLVNAVKLCLLLRTDEDSKLSDKTFHLLLVLVAQIVLELHGVANNKLALRINTIKIRPNLRPRRKFVA